MVCDGSAYTSADFSLSVQLLRQLFFRFQPVIEVVSTEPAPLNVNLEGSSSNLLITRVLHRRNSVHPGLRLEFPSNDSFLCCLVRSHFRVSCISAVSRSNCRLAGRDPQHSVRSVHEQCKCMARRLDPPRTRCPRKQQKQHEVLKEGPPRNTGDGWI